MTTTAATIMTRDVISVGPHTAVREISALLAKHAISAVPVIGADGELLGMVSEGDLMKPFSAENQVKRAWWLEMLAEGEQLAPEFRQYIAMDNHTAHDVMTREVITAPVTATLPELAGLLTKHRIKRVPILDGKKVAGIVSRADIVRSIAKDPSAASL